MEKVKVRNSNIELLRILAMMSVVALHYVHGEMGGVEQYAVFPGFIWFFVAIVRSLAIPMVNVFILITGFFMIRKSRFNYRKFTDLLCIVVFYGLLIYLVSSLLQRTGISLSGLLHSIFPFFFGGAWFIKTYLILLLLIPFLNKALSDISIQGYRRILIVQVLLFSVWYSIGLDSPVLDNGYGIINFITLYIIGGYIGRFAEECQCLVKCTFKIGCAGYLLCAALTAVASVFINPFGYAFITNILAAVCIMIAAVKREKWQNKAVNLFASHAFDVFFVHGKWLFILLGIERVLGSPLVVLHILLALVCSYLFGTVCGIVRAAVFTFTIDKVLDRVQCINREYTL